MVDSKILFFCAVFLAFPFSIAAQPVGEQYEVSPEELDAAFTASDYEATKARFTRFAKPIYPKRVEVTPTTLLKKADLVIEGVVADIHYSYEESGAPLTHTEVEITRIVKGTYNSPSIVIDQRGGLTKDGTSAVMLSHTYYFDEGESELLFLKFLEAGKPMIVNRFRIHEGKLYNEDGYGVLLDANRALRLSKVRSASEHFRLINIGPHRIWKNFSEPNIRVDISKQEGTTDQGASVVAGYNGSISVEDLIVGARGGMSKTPSGD